MSESSSNGRGRPTNESRGLPPTGIFSIRLPLPQIEFINEMAKLNQVRTSQLMSSIIAHLMHQSERETS